MRHEYNALYESNRMSIQQDCKCTVSLNFFSLENSHGSYIYY